MPVFPGGWHPSASGAVKWPSDPTLTEGSFERTFIADLYDEIREEIGLFRSSEEKYHCFETEEIYRPFRSFVGNLEGDDILQLQPVAFCREMLRGGKPQLFFIGYTPLNWAELTSRRVMATKVANKAGRREEIDQRLVHMMPELTGHDDQYGLWSRPIHESGYTFELLPMLYYAAQLSPKVLIGSA
jgi:hypothetical protein